MIGYCLMVRRKLNWHVNELPRVGGLFECVIVPDIRKQEQYYIYL